MPTILEHLARLPIDDDALVDGVAAWIAGGRPDPTWGVDPTTTPDPSWLGHLHALRRRATDPEAAAVHGVVYTPAPAARALAEAALAHRPGLPTVLDPACGGGALLLAAARVLWDRAGATTAAARADVVRACLRGTDVDARAVAIARRALALACGVDAHALHDVVRAADALRDDPGPAVDVVLANPPWVDSARMAAHDPDARRAIAARFATARGNWDLCCPFVERCVALAPDGVVAVLVPDRVASAPYATAVRALLHGTRAVVDLLDLRDADLGVDARAVGVVSVPGRPDDRLPVGGDPWPLADDAADRALVQATAGWPRLRDVAAVTGAATVAEAYAWVPHLTSGAPDADHLPVANSGTIDPWTVHWADAALRYLGRSVRRPVVAVAALSPTRRAQAHAPKLVVAGLTRTLEAFADVDGGWVGAKSTVLVVPATPDDVPWLAAWVHSAAASRLYRVTWGGLALSGGYLRVGPAQLGALPVPPPGPLRARLDALGRRRLGAGDDAARAQVDAAIDAVCGQAVPCDVAPR